MRSGVTLKVRVKSGVTQEELGVELLPPHPYTHGEKSTEEAQAYWTPPCRGVPRGCLRGTRCLSNGLETL